MSVGRKPDLFVTLILLSLSLRGGSAQTAVSKADSEDRRSSMGRLAQIYAARGTARIQGGSPGCVFDCRGGFQDNLPSTQAETSIAVDATGQHIVVGFNDFRGFSNNPLSLSGFSYSDDGGVTFRDGGQLPTTTNAVINGVSYPQVFGDPDVKYLGACAFIYSSILVKAISPDGVAQTMSIHRSTDCGHTWSGPFEVTAATNPNGALTGPNATDAADKEFIDVDPDTGRVCLSWTNFTSAVFAPGQVEMSATCSDNITSPTPAWSPRRVISETLGDGQSSVPRFAGNSSPNVYVAWERFAGLGKNIGFARSTDNGNTWGAPINQAPANFLTMDQVLGNDRVNTSPILAVDNSAGAFRGNIYVVYANNNSGDGADIAFQRSTNEGVSFSSPVFLNSRPGNDRAQWFPFVTVDKTIGRVFVLYYDQGIRSSGDSTEVTFLYSDDGGVTWSKPAALSNRPFHAGWGNDTSQPNLGDYNGATAQMATLFAAFAGHFANRLYRRLAGGVSSTRHRIPEGARHRSESGTTARIRKFHREQRK